MSHVMQCLAGLAALALAAFASSNALAQQPGRPITIIVPY